MIPYYQHAGVTIYCGDCREILPQLSPVELVLTDPPYREDFRFWESLTEARLEDGGILVTLLGAKQLPEALPALSRKWRFWWVVGMSQEGFTPLAGTQCIVRFKIGLWFVNQTFARKSSTYPHDLQPAGTWKTGEHPWEQGVSWFRHWILTTGYRTVLDPFMGSGTTLLAAKALGVPAIGVEIEERWCERAAKRLAQDQFDFLPWERRLITPADEQRDLEIPA